MSAFWAKTDAGTAATERERTWALLEDIRDQRAKLRFVFEEGVTSLQGLTGALLDFDDAVLRVEVSRLAGVSVSFQGASLTCLFRIRQARGRELFFAFDTRVGGMRKEPSGMVVFLLDFPRNLRNAQMRRSVRVQADRRKIPELSLWPQFPGGSPARLPAPLLGPDRMAEKSFRVENISANGLRLCVENGLMRAALPDAAKGVEYAIRFLALGERGGTPRPFWVRAVLRYVERDPAAGETALGFEFVAEGVLDEKEKLVWRPLRFGEVTGLGKFIFKWNLELYREKGIGEG